MPYKTRRGSHYHMTEGCCNAFIQCDTKGLEPCAICCGGAGKGGNGDGGPAGMAGAPATTGDGMRPEAEGTATGRPGKVVGKGATTGKGPSPARDAMAADAVVEAGLSGIRGGMRAPGDLTVTATDMADALAGPKAGADAPRPGRIGKDTDFALRPMTGDGTATSLRDLVAHGHDPKGLYDALRGCEWSAEAMADVLNAHDRMLYAHGWKAVRTAPRHLAVEGKDAFGNIRVLYASLRGDEPDMCEGTSLRISLTNRSRVNLAVSNKRRCSYCCG